MAEEVKKPLVITSDIAIKKCEQGFIVMSSHFGLDEIRAFSTAEGLIEWLSRELGAGPIVWSLTLEIWQEMAGIKAEDLLPVPDPSVDQRGYRTAIEDNAMFLLHRFVGKALEKERPKPPPEPKPKKEKKVKEEKQKGVLKAADLKGLSPWGPEKEKPKEEVKEE